MTNDGKDTSGVIKLVEALPNTNIGTLNVKNNGLNDDTKDKLRSAGPDIKFEL